MRKNVIWVSKVGNEFIGEPLHKNHLDYRKDFLDSTQRRSWIGLTLKPCHVLGPFWMEISRPWTWVTMDCMAKFHAPCAQCLSWGVTRWDLVLTSSRWWMINFISTLWIFWSIEDCLCNWIVICQQLIYLFHSNCHQPSDYTYWKQLILWLKNFKMRSFTMTCLQLEISRCSINLLIDQIHDNAILWPLQTFNYRKYIEPIGQIQHHSQSLNPRVVRMQR